MGQFVTITPLNFLNKNTIVQEGVPFILNIHIDFSGVSVKNLIICQLKLSNNSMREFLSIGL